jgi:hypothetical protein
MRSRVGFNARHMVGMAVAALLLGACEHDAPTWVEGLELQPETLQSVVTSGTARLRITVEKDDGSPAVGSVVAVVYKGAGPIRWAKVGSTGVVTFTDMPNNTSVCAHARSYVALSTAQHVRLYPAPVGTELDEPEGDPTQAPVITGPGGTSLLVSRETYLENCVHNPPVAMPSGRNWVDVKLQHQEAGTIDVAVRDLTGFERRDLQRGIILGGFIPGSSQPLFTCDDIPWLADGCDPDVPPGFLQSHTQEHTSLSFVPGEPFRIEALDRVLLDGRPVELVGTAGYKESPGPLVILGGEQLACNGDLYVEDAIGDARVLDIQGRVKHSIGVHYGEELTPDPTRVMVWFNMTADEGSLRYSTRTVFEGETSTRTFNAEYALRYVDGVYTCTLEKVWGAGVELGFGIELFCSVPVEGMTRVTIIQSGLFPPWLFHEFNVTTRGPGGGDSTEDPERSGPSRAWTEFVNSDVCTVPGGNDDRLDIRI